MTYTETLLALFLTTLAFIWGLMWFRTKRNGDYTVVKVGIGVGFTIAAQWVVGGIYGISVPVRADLLLWPFCVSGGAIIVWQAVELGRRQWQRHERRLRELERGK